MSRQDVEFDVKDCPCVICGKMISFVSYWRPCCCEEHFYEYHRDWDLPGYLKRLGKKVVRDEMGVKIF